MWVVLDLLPMGKGFTKIIEKVHEEFDEAIINLNISFAKFGDERGNNARKIAEIAQKITKEKRDSC